MADWKPIDEAPKDGRPVWARGWDWGKPDTSRHCGWVFFNDGLWQWERDGSVATHLSEWLEST